MTEKNTNLTSQWFELGSDAYRTYVKSLIWGQERVLDFTRTMLGRTDTFEKEGKSLADEYATNLRHAQKIFQETVNSTVKTSTDLFRQYRDVTNESLSAVSSTLNNLQVRADAAIEAATPASATKTATK